MTDVLLIFTMMRIQGGEFKRVDSDIVKFNVTRDVVRNIDDQVTWVEYPVESSLCSKEQLGRFDYKNIFPPEFVYNLQPHCISEQEEE